MIEVRSLANIEEYLEAVELQKTIWGFEDIELLPGRLFVVASKIGGQTFGAFDGKRMIAFGLAIPGLKPAGQYYLHSHMLGVLPQYRNAGVGRMIKLSQRQDAIARGIELVEWTFDPLEIKNAYFNIERLGAIVRRYVLNQYGTTTSKLHGGLPTDRCIAEWWVSNPRVNALLDNGPQQQRPSVEARICVPNDIDKIRTDDPRRAREIQSGISAQFIDYFDRGLAVIGFERSETAGTYLLGPWQSK